VGGIEFLLGCYPVIEIVPFWAAIFLPDEVGERGNLFGGGLVVLVIFQELGRFRLLGLFFDFCRRLDVTLVFIGGWLVRRDCTTG